MSSSLYISSSPSLSSLGSYLVQLPFTKNPEFGVPQLLKAKSRELARSDLGLLAAPRPEEHVPFGRRVPIIWIVAKPNAMASNGKVRRKLKELDLQLVEKVNLTPSILQTCLTFTAIARLAPKWNRVSMWLVQGSDFLSTSRASAVDFEVNISSTDIALTVNVCKLFINYLKVLKEFSEDPDYIISENQITCKRCLVLPNMTQAFVYSASHGMPHFHEQKFSTYDQLRLHWKKQHGIMLPEVQQLFYQVFFGVNTSKLFSYPACCVLQSAPLVYNDKDTHITATSFVHDLHSRMPTICGTKMAFSPKALSTVSNLNPATSSQPGAGEYANTIPASQPTGAVAKDRAMLPVNQSSKPPSGQSARCINAVTMSQPARQVDSIPASQPVSSNFQENVKRFPLFGGPSNRVPKIPPASAGNERENSAPGALKRALVSDNHSTPTPKKPCFDSTNTASHHIRATATEQSSLQASGHAFPSCGETVQSAVVPNTQQASSSSANVVTTGKSGQVSTSILLQVGKCKVPELKKWLQEKGVKNHSKKKKEELVSMITSYIAKTGCAYP